jgi:DNA-binding MarR family transcriptional regulator
MSANTFRLDDSIVQRLSMASLAVRTYRSELYKTRYDLTVAGWQVLARIYERGPAVQRQLCLWNNMDKVTVSRASAKLVKRKLLSRVNHNQDQRSQYLFLTPSGEELCRQMVYDAQAMNEKVYSDMSPNERYILVGFLARTQITVCAHGDFPQWLQFPALKYGSP